MNSSGDLPAACAERSTFWPCSSVPVVSTASKPCMRLKRLMVSAAKRGVSVADVRRGVHVVERRREVIFHFVFFKYA